MFSVLLGTSRDGGKTLHKTTVYESALPPVPTGLAVDKATGEIYICWTPRYEGSEESSLMLATSRDQGRTWAVKPIRATQGSALDVRVGTVSLAINEDGVLGFLWYGRNGDRAFFGISVDGGESIARVVALTPDSSIDLSNGPLADDRRLFVFPPSWDIAAGHLGPLQILSAGPNLSGVPFGTALVADIAGSFHPIWNEVANGPTHLWTRVISIEAPGKPKAKPTVDGLTEISDRVVTHVNNVRYDQLEHLVAFDLTVSNKSPITIEGPIVVSVSNSIGPAKQLAGNPDNSDVGGISLWELQVPADGLGCEHSTEPRTLTFRMTSKNEDELDVPLKFYGKLR